MRAHLFLIPLLLSSAACSSQEDMARKTGVSPQASASARASAAPAMEGEAMRLEDKDSRDGAERTFGYVIPAAAGAIPQLTERLIAERDKALADQKAEWATALRDEPADCVPCRARGFEKEWKVVADTPGFLSLSAMVSTYTGGAHGMYNLESLVWDRKAARATPAIAMFQSADALEQALGPRLCRALDAERVKRRGEPMPRETGDDYGFSSCQKVKDATVLVGSASGKAFDRVGIWFGPYVAGPYAEGAYELNFPVDAAVLKAVKPEFAPAFAARP